MRLTKTKIAVAVATTAVVALGSTAAYAYFTSSGSGSSSATVANPGPNTISVIDFSIGPITLGGTTPIAYTLDNTASVNQFITSVAVAVPSTFTAQADVTKPACTAADFQPSAPQTNFGQSAPGLDLHPGLQGIGSTLSITLKDSATNQDNCKGVSVPLVFTTN